MYAEVRSETSDDRKGAIAGLSCRDHDAKQLPIDRIVRKLNNSAMVAFLESQLKFLESRSEADSQTLPNAERVQLVEDLIAFHLTALERLEKHLTAKGLSERDRPLVPLFQRWLKEARRVKDLAKELKGSVEGVGIVQENEPGIPAPLKGY